MSKNKLFLLTTLLFFSLSQTHSIILSNEPQDQIPQTKTILVDPSPAVVAASTQLPQVSTIDPLDNCRQLDVRGKCIECFTNYKLGINGLCVRQQVVQKAQENINNCLVFSQQTNQCIVCQLQFQFNAGKCIKILKNFEIEKDNEISMLRKTQIKKFEKPVDTNQSDNSIVQPLEILTLGTLQNNLIKQNQTVASPLLLTLATSTPVLNSIQNSLPSHNTSHNTSPNTSPNTSSPNVASSSPRNSTSGEKPQYQPIDPSKFNITIVIDPKTKMVITIIGTTLSPPENHRLANCIKYRDITYECVQCQKKFRLFQQKCYDQFQYQKIISQRGLVYNQPNSN